MNNKPKFKLEPILKRLGNIPEPLWLLGIGIITYGLLIPHLGFYLDDWYIVLFQKYFGSGHFTEFFRGDRPFFGFIYDVFVPIFGDSQFAWQSFAVITHSLAAISLWFLLKSLLPDQKRFNLLTSIFFLVYPGFKFHWFAVMYSQVYLLYAIYFISFLLMILAMTSTRGRIWLILGAIICQVIGIVPQETFIGLEFIRPLIIFITAGQIDPALKVNKLKTTILTWLPYLGVFIAFTVYRILNNRSFGYQVSFLDLIKKDPANAITLLVNNVFRGASEGIVSAWTSVVSIFDRNLFSVNTLLMVALILFGSAITCLLLFQKNNQEKGSRIYANAIWIGLLASIVAILPFLAGGFPVNLEFPNNRYLIAVAPGSALFLAGIVEYFLRTDRQKVILSSILVGFAITSQFIAARTFQRNWDLQREFFWQFSWRAPAIAENTAIISEDLPFSMYSSGTSLTAPLNLIYSPDNKSHRISYLFVLLTQQDDLFPSFADNQPISSTFRSFDFNGSINEVIVFKKPSIGCMRILTPASSVEEMGKTVRNQKWYDAILKSNLSLIIPDPVRAAIPPEKYFGKEDKNQWCYYFEKADLARQQGKWDETVEWYLKGFAENYHPLNQFEWLPLIDVYLKLNNTEKALETTRSIPILDSETNDSLCNLWTTIGKTEKNAQDIGDALRLAQCEIGQ